MNNGSRDFQREKDIISGVFKRHSPKYTHRVSFDFTEVAYDAFTAMVGSTNSTSKADVLRKALRLLEWYQNKMDEGYDLCLKKGAEIISVEKKFNA